MQTGLQIKKTGVTLTAFIGWSSADATGGSGDDDIPKNGWITQHHAQFGGCLPRQLHGHDCTQRQLIDGSFSGWKRQISELMDIRYQIRYSEVISLPEVTNGV